MSHEPFPCRLILSEPASGAMNMALDEALLEAVGDEAVLRIYQWSRPTLSLGYFQAAAERESHAASRTCDLVRRPSGGGAILHDRELTYCLVLPEAIAKSQPHTHWYFAVHRALIASLDELCRVGRVRESHQVPSDDFHVVGLADSAHPTFSLCHNPPDVPVGQEPFLCFQRRAEGDVLLGEHKIAGSAQRRRGGAILQHGSVLLARSPHAPELPGILDLAPRTFAFAQLHDLLVRAIMRRLGFERRESEVSEPERRAAKQLHTAKYTVSSWTQRR